MCKFGLQKLTKRSHFTINYNPDFHTIHFINALVLNTNMKAIFTVLFGKKAKNSFLLLRFWRRWASCINSTYFCSDRKFTVFIWDSKAIKLATSCISRCLNLNVERFHTQSRTENVSMLLNHNFHTKCYDLSPKRQIKK